MKWYEEQKILIVNISSLFFLEEASMMLNIYVGSYITAPVSSIGMFEIDDISFRRPKLTVYLALTAGSSKQGKARLASVG